MADSQDINVRDSDDIKNILIQVDLKNNRTQVLSSFTAWEHIALLTEAIGASIDECLEEGLDKGEVLKEVQTYHRQLIATYKD